MDYRCAFREAHLLEQVSSSKEAAQLKEALEWFDKGEAARAHGAIEQLVLSSHPLALVLASMFSRPGETEEQYCTRHLSQLQAAAALDNSLALYSLGVYADTGELLEHDEVEAFRYFKRAAELGMPQAQHIYGVMLYYGTGGADKDSERGLKLVNRAADAGVAEATEFLEYLQKQ